jgi:cytochrome c553
MSVDHTSPPESTWRRASIGLTGLCVVLTALGGLVLLPSLQSNVSYSSLWDAICSAAGVLRQSRVQQAVEPNFKISQVVLRSDTLSKPSPESIGRGATLAQRCAICHGPSGISGTDSPNLAGQYASVIYKELLDFQSGARVNSIMSTFAEPLSDPDIVDLAAYYSDLPRPSPYHPDTQTPAPRIVINGAPIRGIAPCGSCHGNLDNKAGSPWLEQQPQPYMVSQLQAFAAGTRHNDLGQQMRNIARQMTAEEIVEATHYYASRPAANISQQKMVQ